MTESIAASDIALETGPKIVLLIIGIAVFMSLLILCYLYKNKGKKKISIALLCMAVSLPLALIVLYPLIDSSYGKDDSSQQVAKAVKAEVVRNKSLMGNIDDLNIQDKVYESRYSQNQISSDDGNDISVTEKVLTDRDSLRERNPTVGELVLNGHKVYYGYHYHDGYIQSFASVKSEDEIRDALVKHHGNITFIP